MMASANRAADIMFFSFRSAIMASAIDQRFSSITLSLDYSLRLPESIIPTASAPSPTLASNIYTPPSTPDPTMVKNPASRPTSAFTLNNATDGVLALMDVMQLRQFILDARPSSNPVSGVTTPIVNLLPSFIPLPSSSIPKMDRARKSIASVSVTTYLCSLDLLDSQANFDSIFGPNPIMLRVSKRTDGTRAIEEKRVSRNTAYYVLQPLSASLVL